MVEMVESKQLDSGGRVDTPENLDKLMEKVARAQETYAKYSQEAVDRIFRHCALVANQHRVELAELAFKEAGMGNIEDKTLKNHFASEVIYHAYKDMKTCGVVERNEEGGYALYAEPVGVLAGIVPCTNPTSTTVFKALLALKTRNAIVFSPHPRTVQCTIAAARILRDAAVEAGAPEGLIGWIDKGSIELCNQLMRHEKVSVIVATGAGGLVKAAYSAGKPCMGGGAGNTPVIIDETADIPMAVNSVLLSKTFDHGMICASEQSVVVVRQAAERVRQEFLKRGGHFVSSRDDKDKLAQLIFQKNGMLNPAAVGQAAHALATAAGLQHVPPGCRALLAELTGIGPEEPLSREKLCPCLGFMVVDDFDAALEAALRFVQFGGMGHTSVLYTDLHGSEKKARVTQFEAAMPTGRTLVCMPTSQGGIGGLYNAYQTPSLSLGCGSWGGNTSAEGLQPKHLLNYKQLAERRNEPLSFKVPASVCFGRGIVAEVLKQLHSEHQQPAALKRALLLVTGADGGDTVGLVKTALEEQQLPYTVFSGFDDQPLLTAEAVMRGVKEVEACGADVLVAVGDARAMSACKLVRLLAENPSQSWKDLGTRFLSITKKIVQIPAMGAKIKKTVCIPTTSGSGGEMSPFAVAEWEHGVVTIADQALTPDVAIVDFNIPRAMPQAIATESGFDALGNALESLVALTATDYTRNLSLEALELLFKNLLLSATTGDPEARGDCHRAAGLAGMAAANAFLGIAEALTNQLALHFKVPRGLAKAMVLCQVIRFNAEEAPSKLASFPQYEKPKAKCQYAHALIKAGLVKKHEAEDVAVDTLVTQLGKLKAELEVPASLQKYGIDENAFMDKLDLLSRNAFDDQMTGSNPRYPLISELRQILLDAFHGRVRSMRFDETFLAAANATPSSS